MKLIFFHFLIISALSSEIIQESGDIIEFFSGNSPNTSYDNWISHVSEGIAEENYNDYGPDWLDIQSNGFGSYRKLNEGSGTLDYWEIIFQNFLNNNLNEVDLLLNDSLESFFYEIVIFQDTVLNRTYHILREQLDTSFIDLNQIDNNEDDIVGSFRNGWGLYIINPNAEREQVLIQVPHPCDDFIAPYVAMDLFIEVDALGFMINGAGREVQWSEEGNYSNNKSISDPSRYEHTIFQKFQEITTTPLMNLNPHSPIVFAIHSFDNLSHYDRKSIIIAGGAHNSYTTKPIRDITDDHFDIINFTEEFPIIANQFTNESPLHITDYYEAYYDDYFFYDNGVNEFSIIKASELRGPINCIQMIDLQSQINEWSVYEPWIQIELDEKPMLFDSLLISNDSVYQRGMYPVGNNNFSIIKEYYSPFIQGVKNYLNHWENIIDITPPDTIKMFWASNSEIVNEINLSWEPEYDSNFKSYEIQFDNVNNELTNQSEIINFINYPDLQYMRKNSYTINNINNTENWNFRIRAIDHFENTSDWSEIVSNLLPGHSPPDTILNFNNPDLIINSLEQDDINDNNFEVDSTTLMPGNSFTLSLFGHNWKSIPIDSFLIDSNTVLQIFSKVDSLSKIQAIGFSDGSKSIKYSLYGNEQLDIEEWITVYQGQNNLGNWHSYNFPLGDDWLAWYDSLSTLTEIYFINDNNNSFEKGNIHFSMIRNITNDLHISPSVTIDFETNINHTRQIASVQFNSNVNDTDSYSFLYLWDFGDGNYSQLENPIHEYSTLYDFEYTIVLMVEDETGKRGYSSINLNLNENNLSNPLTLNFVGDIMMGRRYESDDGIITNQGIYTLFEPTFDLLGNSADLTIANLEIVLSDNGTPHPTKTINFRCDPENVNGLIFAGIDIVSLANNNIMDYGVPAMIETKTVLDAAGILHSGAGLNSYQAYLPTIKSIKGKKISFISSSDRTGQYNNYQPYLNAGENKPGFAYLTPYHLKQQIKNVKEFTDYVIVEMHAGSEYSYSPGSNYDNYEPPENFENLRINPASETGFIQYPSQPIEDEDYSWRLDRPQMWDRALRHFAIDEGAEAVIVHHPHIIQGVEIYNGKLIAHSLGNFIFDLNYAETFPSMILNSELNQNNQFNYTITPIYIDDYIPKPATGELGNYILNYIAMKSRELDTYVHVNQSLNKAYVISDTSNLSENLVNYSITNIEWEADEFFFISKPILLPEAGSISEILNNNSDVSHYRLGRELIWMGNFENEGSSIWNLNSNNEFLQDSIFRRGSLAIAHIRDENSPNNIITNLENKFPFKNHLKHTLHGNIKSENGKNITLELRLSFNRTNENILSIALDDSINGYTDWKKYWKNIDFQENVNFFDVIMNTGVPDSGVSKTWFDDVGLIQWDTIQILSNDPIDIINPNNYDYIQFISQTTPNNQTNIELENSIIGELSYLQSNPKCVNNTIIAPGYAHFFDESLGPIGSWIWNFDDNLTSNLRHPSHYFFDPGIYNISLTVYGLNGNTNSNHINLIVLSADSNEHITGDINNDNNINDLDLIYCSSYILGLIELSPEQFISADINSNNIIDIFDIYNLLALYN